MRRRVLSLATLAVLAVLLVSASASAQDVRGGLGAGVSSPPDRDELNAGRPYWSSGDPRWFAAATFSTAGLGAKIALDVGYGKPHHQWLGMEVEPQISLNGLGAFGGIRGATPWGYFRFGPRFFTALSQHLVEEAEMVTRPMLDVYDGPRSRYLSLDAEINTSIPLPLGSIGLLMTAYGIVGVDDDFFVFEDSLRVVVDPPFVARMRVNYLAPVGTYKTFRMGGMVEGIYNPQRDYINVRTGPAVAVSITHHLEALAAVAFSVYNPDDIGLAGADLGQIGLRYRWASGDKWPEFP